MNLSIIIYVLNKDIALNQVKKFILNNIKVDYIFILINDDYKSLFSNYGNVFIENNYQYKSNCYQDVYTSLKSHNYDKVLEINPNFFINYKYIEQCLRANNDIVGSNTFISYDDIMYINQLKNIGEINNIIYCRCFNKHFLEKVNYKIFDFTKNENIFELSQMSCIIYSSDILHITTQHVYKKYDNVYNSDIYQSILLSSAKKLEILDIIDLDLDIYFNQQGIKNVQVSNDIIYFKDKIKSNYNLLDNNDTFDHKMFFGMYSDNDIKDLINFTGKRFILWAGSDVDDRIPHVKNNIEHIQLLENITHFAISKSISDRLLKYNINSTLINFSLINKSLYKKVSLDNNSRSKRIYVYDGNNNDLIYNVTLCRQISTMLSDKYEFIFRSDIDYNEKEMIAFYQSCFMGIRLCEQDGNANTVQEMGLLGLPVLHNGPMPNSVAWINDIDYICEKIDYIHNNFQNKKSIISNSVSMFINGDEREEMCIFVPMWHRHNTTEKNLHLLSHQNYIKTQIIVIYSNESDEQFCNNLNYSNLHPIKVENRPLSKKFQFGAEYTKIFYPYGIIINGSDDFLSLNFASCVHNNFKTTNTTYFGCNFWYVGDTVSMLLYKFTYNDPLRVVGCGRSFKYTLLNDMNWQVFPLIKNSGIDGASKVMIQEKAIPFATNDPYCFTISFKEETDMITPMSNLLKSEHSEYEIISNNNLNQILYSNTLMDLQTTFKLKQTISNLNRYLFITLLDDNLKKSNPIMLNSYYMENILSSQYDVMDLRELETRKNFDYSLIFIDAISLNTRTTKLNRDKLFSYLAKIRHIPKVLLSHDIHDYSYDFENNCQPLYCNKPLKPNYNMNDLKAKYLEFLQINNIEYIIGICDCPELDIMVKYYSKQIKQFYLMTHHIPENIFYYKGYEKKYDILIYGWANEIVYPFRDRLKKLFAVSPFRVKIIERTADITKMPIEHDLADIINESWLVITCVSNFSYLVRKYFEIGACGSIPCGNINNQGREIFQGNMIEIDEQMSDYEIIKIISYYLNNKFLLMKMSDEIRELAMKYNYNTFMKNLIDIKDNIIYDSHTNLIYENQKQKYEPYSINYMHATNESMVINDWLKNQQSTLVSNDQEHTVTVKQNTSTPGMKTSIMLKENNYILTFGVESKLLKTKVYIFNEKSVQLSVNEQTHDCMTCVNISVSRPGKYSIFILTTNPQIDETFIIKNPILHKLIVCPLNHDLITPIRDNLFSKVFYGSLSCVNEVQKLARIFNGKIINKVNILKQQYDNIICYQHSKILVLIGFYSPHHWSKYKELFDLFETVFIIFTGTDILQLNDAKVDINDKMEIKSFLKSLKCICGALNVRNKLEIKSLHNINCHIISLPVSPVQETGKYNIIPNSNKIACYMSNNLEWYCHDIILQVAMLLHEYEFYIYKYDGFSSEIINNNNLKNVIYNTETIVNIQEFMSDKLCSLRVTFHDGEPMTGIETMLMGKPFLFNHEMKYSIPISNNPDEIAHTIKNLIIGDNKESIEYYTIRNSNRNFEKNIKCFLPKMSHKIDLLANMITNSIETLNDKDITIPIVGLINNRKYRLILNGHVTGYCKLIINNGKIIDNTFNIMQKYETCNYIDFIGRKTTKLVLQIRSNNELCNVSIDSLDVFLLL